VTRDNDYYLTITESKKRFKEDGTFDFQKHKILFYKEEFSKFDEALKTCIDKIGELQ